MIWIRKIIDFVLYSNIYIGLCAVALALETQILLGKKISFSPLILLVFSSTLVIYALHRLVGLSKVAQFIDKERYKVIEEYKTHIWIYAILAIIGGAISFFYLSRSVQIGLIIPGLISLAYVLPVFGGNKSLRLRDFNFIKIFLVALVWAYVTVVLPILDAQVTWTWIHVGWVSQAILFIFAITLPFDIRDLDVDQFNKVNTLPAKLGKALTVKLAILCLAIALIIGWLTFPDPFPIGLSLVLSITAMLVVWVSNKKHDYYFTGLLDGTMILHFCGVAFLWF